MEKPVWNEANRSDSLARFAVWLNEQARLSFLRDGAHAEFFFLMDERGEGGIIPLPPDVDQDQVALLLRDQIKELQLYAFVHVAETWTYIPHINAGERPVRRQLVEGTIALSKLEPGQQAEALMVHVESRDGYAHLWLNPIVRAGNRVALADAVDIPGGPAGRFAGMFA